MYSLYQRLNNVFALTLSASTVLIAVLSVWTAVFMMRLPSDQAAAVSFTIDKAELSVGQHDYPFFDKSRKEYLFVEATLNADLVPLFHWNTKEIFLYFTVEYEGTKHAKNELTLWDHIVLENPKGASFRNYAITNKYPIADIDLSFRNRNVTFALQWEAVPYFGALAQFRSERSVSLKLPSSYTARPKSE